MLQGSGKAQACAKGVQQAICTGYSRQRACDMQMDSMQTVSVQPGSLAGGPTPPVEGGCALCHCKKPQTHFIMCLPMHCSAATEP